MTGNPNQTENSTVMPKIVDLCCLASEGPYAPQAYAFVQDGLRYAAQQLFGQRQQQKNDPQNLQNNHLNGRELSIGLGNFAIERYGLLAQVVLEHWNVHRTDDFGRIVFRMIESGLLSRQDEDTLEDFFGIYDFDTVFERKRILRFIAAGNQENDHDDGSAFDFEALAGSSS